MKRWLFPFALWESGRHAASAVPEISTQLELGPGDTVVLHTTFLAPAIAALRATGARVFVDVHDLVWRAHRMEATDAGLIPWAARTLYALGLRRREESLLAGATGLMVCGWRDSELLSSVASATWTPVGIPSPNVGDRQAGEIIRVGLIGNFLHGPTMASARKLVDGPLGGSSDVELVFAGFGSDSERTLGSAVVLGRVASVEEFYDEVDAVVAPYVNGAGMKCKLAEAALAGKLVVTTPAGAHGYPPELRARLVIVDDIGTFRADELRGRLNDPGRRAESRAAFERLVGVPAAAALSRTTLAIPPGPPRSTVARS